MSGGGGSSSTTRSIPDELKPLANMYVKQAENIANTPWQGYGGQRYADPNATQNMGISMVEQRALNGDPTMRQANTTLQQTLQGGNANPYLDQMVNKAQGSVLANANVAAAKSGSFGNSGIAGQAAKQMGDVATSMYGGAYDQDRARQMQALQLAPTYGDQAYKDAGQLMNAGNMRQGFDQRNLDFNYQQFQDRQNDPYKKLQATGGVINSGSGQTTTQQGGK